MRTRLLGLATGAAMIAAATVVGLGTASAETNGGVTIMPLGDSITDGFNVPGGYRTELWQRLVSGGYTVDFVGSQYNGPTELGDHDHQGLTGWEIDQIDAQVVTWLGTYQPHTIMLMIGTNDILHNIDVANAPTRLENLLDDILTTLPDVELFVASITPLGGDYASYEAQVQTYNASVPTLVDTKAGEGYQVHYVDMHSVLTTADLYDGIHPSSEGYEKMGAAWYTALTSVPSALTDGGSSATPSSPGVTTSAAGSASASASATTSASPSQSVTSSASSGETTCAATYQVIGEWPGGFQAQVTVTAGASAITGWTTSWTLSDGQAINQSWGATVTVSGSTVAATNVSYNGALAAGASTSFGFLGEYSSANPTPELTCTAL